MKAIQTTKLEDLSDRSAKLEAERIRKVALARWEQLSDWMGFSRCAFQDSVEESGFELGMLALFRYARGADVPPFIVQSFIDELLTTMFAGLSSGAIALPTFEKMSDKPWAIAWRIAELRLAIERNESMDTQQFAHLMGVHISVVEAEILKNGYSDLKEIPAELLRTMVGVVID